MTLSRGQVRGATLAVADLDRSVSAYRDHLGLGLLSTGEVSEELARHWGAPMTVGRRTAVLGPESGTDVPIRLVECESHGDPFRPLRHYGWAALEITIRDADALFAGLTASPFEIIGPPRPLEGMAAIYPGQVVGPDGEVLYLNEVRSDLSDYDLPRADSFVDHIFIVVLAARDLESSLAFYESALAFERGDRYEIPIEVLNRAFDFDPSTRHELVMCCLGRTVNVEVDAYPEGTTERPARAGDLPAGVATVAFAVDDLDRVAVEWRGPIQRLDGTPYHGRRAATCVGAGGEWLELIEVGA